MATHRAPVIDNVPDGTRVTMFAEHNALLVTVALGWLGTGLALTGVSFLGLADASSPDRWWSLVVTALGLANALPALAYLLFVLVGREVVVVGPLQLEWRQEALFLSRTKLFRGPLTHVTESTNWRWGPRCFLTFYSDDGRFMTLGTGMTQAESQAVVLELRNRYPNLRPEGFVPLHPRMG